MTTKNHSLLFIGILILAAGLTRLMPHPVNFTAIGAMALFGGARISSGALSLLIPTLALLFTDFILGFHGTMWGVYLGFSFIWLIGRLFLKNGGFSKIAAASVAGSVLFFLLSNFAVWAEGLIYSRTLDGLISCYAAALPFYSNDILGSFALNTLLGDWFFNLMLFGAFSLYSRFMLRTTAI